jgi:hypothetical protein
MPKTKTPLTNPLRAQIRNIALTHGFEKRLKALEESELQLTNNIWEALWGKHREAIEALPKGWYLEMDDTRTIPFTIGGEHTYLKVNTKLRWPSITYNAFRINDRQVVRMWHDHAEEKKKYDEEYRVAHATLDAMLKGYRTIESLRDGWPEGKAFYKNIERLIPTPPGLPAVQIVKLNEMLGIAA